MGKITLSILGMYNHDETLFDNMVVPTGVNKETLIDNILVECAELELLYPNLTFMKTYLGKWSLSRIDSWTKINNYYNVVINPINEFDYNLIISAKENSLQGDKIYKDYYQLLQQGSSTMDI